MHEPATLLPNLVKVEVQQSDQHDNEVWKLLFDGSRSSNGSGGGCMLISPQGEKYYSSFRFSFSCTNNTVEYESLFHGLLWARKKKIKCLQVFGDSELIVN